MTTADELEGLLSTRGYRDRKTFSAKQGRTTLAKAVVVLDHQYRDGRLDLRLDRLLGGGLLRGFGRLGTQRTLQRMPGLPSRRNSFMFNHSWPAEAGVVVPHPSEHYHCVANRGLGNRKHTFLAVSRNKPVDLVQRFVFSGCIASGGE